MLGVHQLKSDRDLVNLVEQRLHTDSIDRLRRCGLSDEELDSLVVPSLSLGAR
jgi:hypothetical protein